MGIRKCEEPFIHPITSFPYHRMAHRAKRRGFQCDALLYAD
jgi:hypothetical protein